MLLTGWLLFRTPLAASVSGQPYWSLLPHTFLPELGATFFVLLGSLPTLAYLMNGPFRDAAPSNPLFWGILVITGIAGALTVYPYTVWWVSRRGSWVKETKAVFTADKMTRRFST